MIGTAEFNFGACENPASVMSAIQHVIRAIHVSIHPTLPGSSHVIAQTSLLSAAGIPLAIQALKAHVGLRMPLPTSLLP